MAGSQDYAPDPRNAEVLVWLNGELVPRREAKISVFDAGFSLGDGVWEGLRLHKGALLFLEAHLDRLFEGARAIHLEIGMRRDEIVAALASTLAANAMTDGVHVRLMVTRGLKATVSQDPRNALGGPTIVIAAEHKAPPAGRALRLHTASIRCTPREMFDMRLNSHSRLNLITALLDAIEAGADEALMLDPRGFVSSCNATNFFAVRAGEVVTSSGDYCFNGVTRARVIELCREGGAPVRLCDLTLAEAHGADEAFATGTMGGITPVSAIDGHALAAPGPVTRRLQGLYEALKDADAAAHPLR
ncbi:MAG TPA: aminotransferase class IV [Caulobacteraceae bacterium]